jgi:adenylate cyclase class 2
MGFRLLHRRSLEDNTLFDTPGRDLRKARSILRLRRYGDAWKVTFKGRPSNDPLYKSRAELEIAVTEPDALRSLFVSLGLFPAFRYQKFRTTYGPVEIKKAAKGQRSPAARIHREVALDETPVGNFIEIEGSRRWIDQVAKQLGFSKSDYLTASYGALYLEHCAKRKIKPGDMMFDEQEPGRDGRLACP